MSKYLIAILLLSCSHAEKLDLERLKLPPGFHIAVFADAPHARQMVFSPGGVLLVTDMSDGTVLAFPDTKHTGHAERAVTESLDAKWADEGWDVNLSLFDSEIRDPLQALPSGDKLALSNAKGPRRAPGAEALIGYVTGPWHVLASWSYLEASQVDPTGKRSDVPLVPHQAGSLDAILESDQRVGLTGSIT